MSGVTYKPDEWAIQHTPADENDATITQAAVSGYTHYCTSITCTLEGSANAAALIFVLRNGAAGAGTILWTGKLANLANDSKSIALGGLNIQGAKNAAMTLECTANPAATSSVTVALTGYTLASPV